MSARKRNGASVAESGTEGSEPDLVCWQYVPGICRFQTRNLAIARKLGQRSGARLVAWSVLDDYLRIFEERIEPWRARKLVCRYLDGSHESEQQATNRAFSSLKGRESQVNAQSVPPTEGASDRRS